MLGVIQHVQQGPKSVDRAILLIKRSAFTVLRRLGASGGVREFIVCGKKMRSTKGQSGTGIPLRLTRLVLRWDHSSPTPPLAAWLNPQARAITLRVMAV